MELTLHKKNERSISEQVDTIIEKLPGLIRDARARGEEVIPLIMLDESIAKAPLASINGILSVFSFGLAGTLPRDRQDLNHSAYTRLWDHIIELGFQPFIEGRGFGIVSFNFLSARISKGGMP